MPNTFTVLESNISINGEHLIVALSYSAVRLSVGTILYSNEGMRYRIVDSDLKFASKEIMRIIKQKETEGIFFYYLIGIYHQKKPLVGQELTRTENSC